MADREEFGLHTEIGWTDIKTAGSARAKLASAWLGRLVNEHDLWRFTVLGIDTEQLVKSAFGEGKGNQLTNIHKRFYRSCLAYHIASLSRQNDSVRVHRCYHDREGKLEMDEWFRWHAQHRISIEKANVSFGCSEVIFVDSDHKKEAACSQASHFIQLCDILLGATMYGLEAHNPRPGRDLAFESFRPLLERINCPKQSRNINSSYKHVGRASVSYFPERPLTEEELNDPFLRAQSTFYKGRRLKLLEERAGQEGMDF